MKARLLAFSIFLVFGGALVLSGNFPQRGGSASEKKSRPPASNIRVVVETPECRVVEHSLGETRVPLAPRRIASLSAVVTDSLVALGIKPVLVERGWMSWDPAPHLADRLQGVPTIGIGGGRNLEAVLAVQPDLILAGNLQDARLYNHLSKIAPTIYFLNTDGPRENTLLEVGSVLGMAEQAKARLSEYRQRVDQARASLAAAAGQPVAFLRFRMRTCVIYCQTTMFGPLLFEQLGLTPDPMMPDVLTPGGWDVLSPERLAMLRAEHLFVVTDADSEQYFEEIRATPMWRDIPAVRHGHVHCVSPGTWIGGEGVLAYEAIVEDVLNALTTEPRS